MVSLGCSTYIFVQLELRPIVVILVRPQMLANLDSINRLIVVCQQNLEVIVSFRRNLGI